jgi:hypothetical protein
VPIARVRRWLNRGGARLSSRVPVGGLLSRRGAPGNRREPFIDEGLRLPRVRARATWCQNPYRGKAGARPYRRRAGRVNEGRISGRAPIAGRGAPGCPRLRRGAGALRGALGETRGARGADCPCAPIAPRLWSGVAARAPSSLRADCWISDAVPCGALLACARGGLGAVSRSGRVRFAIDRKRPSGDCPGCPPRIAAISRTSARSTRVSRLASYRADESVSVADASGSLGARFVGVVRRESSDGAPSHSTSAEAVEPPRSAKLGPSGSVGLHADAAALFSDQILPRVDHRGCATDWMRARYHRAPLHISTTPPV